MDSEILVVRNLTRSIGSNLVLSDINFSLSKGEVLAVMGPSGCGKTSLLRCLNLLDLPDKGQISLNGEVLFSHGVIKEGDVTRIRMRIGIVFQEHNLWPHKTVLENVIEGPVTTGKYSLPTAIERADSLLSEMKILDKRNERPFNLSVGQKQRVALCRALIMEPQILLLDEITSALDPELVVEILGLVARLAKKGITMIIVTHEILFAERIADRVFFMNNGVITEEGISSEIINKPKNLRTKTFLNSALGNWK